MTVPLLHLGILAHVDAGKTSLTERLLFDTGVIATLGRVDHGDTRTDTLALEKQRGITIQNAVVAFPVGDLTINLIDTPGHADFIAEVERALRVLDAVVLVVSAVEGVQAQTRKLARAVRAAGLPCLVFVNKIDRLGARGNELDMAISDALGAPVAPLTEACNQGSRAASVHDRDLTDPRVQDPLLDHLTMHDEALLARWLETDGPLTVDEMRGALIRATREQRVVPLCHGSALTGAGVDRLLACLSWLAPAETPAGEQPLSAVIFKMQRAANGDKVALARVFGGALRVRDTVISRAPDAPDDDPGYPEKITLLERWTRGATTAPEPIAPAGLVRVHGLRSARIGDVIGAPPPRASTGAFPRPMLESVIRPRDEADRAKLFAALQRLEEQDPLISVRCGERDGFLSARLYGEVQKEVIEATLRDEFGVPVVFEPSQVLCIEEVIGAGEAREFMGDPGNPFVASVGFRIEPGPAGCGFDWSWEPGSLPPAYYRVIEETALATLEEGLCAWPVRDCRVTLTDVGYSSVVTNGGDFRGLVPLVLMTALERAGARVLEPIDRFVLEAPVDRLGEIVTGLLAAGAELQTTESSGERCRLEGVLPAVAVDRLERALPGWSGGLGVLTTRPAGYQPMAGEPPHRQRTDLDPLHRAQYLARLGFGGYA